ncbi:MAG TPA: PQQ-binding-like beta-propeller repeat protein, partial [Candidatus Nanoarchaeia archaeon]|nr:PQQ-binding-like beta-propeller repeat protein [Candidatus Nanoarchaeia archaeon]
MIHSVKKTLIKSKNKMTATSIALLLMLIMTTSLVLLPSSHASTPPVNLPTYSYVTVTPPTIGLGQYVTIVVFQDRISPTAGGALGQVWNGYLVTITKPDGTKDTIGPWTCASATASDFKVYLPTMTGTYTVVFSWPGGTVSSSDAAYSSVYIGDQFLGSTSAPCTFTVTNTTTPNYPETALPQGYWELPINAQNRLWGELPSNWLKGTWLINSYQRWGMAPTSPHVLWTAPICAASPSSLGYAGGLADATWAEQSTNINDYESPWAAPIIMNGIIYYNSPYTEQSDKYGYYAVDLYTGNQIWYKNGTDNGLNNPYITTNPSTGSTNPSYAQAFLGLTEAQMYHYNSVNGQGVFSCLWLQSYYPTSSFPTASTTWYMLDPTTGNLILTMKNVPSGTSVTDQDGSLLVYSFNSATGTILCWNSSKAIYPGGPTSSGAQVWRPAVGSVIDAQNDSAWANTNPSIMGSMSPTLIQALKTPHSGYTMNVTDPSLKGLPAPVAAVPGVSATGTFNVLQADDRTPMEFLGGSIVVTYASGGGPADSDQFGVWMAKINYHAVPYSPWPTEDSSVNTNLGYTVSLQYYINNTVPLPGHNYTWVISTMDYDSQIFVLRCAQTGQFWGYSIATGKQVWGPTAMPPASEQFYYYAQSVGVYSGTMLVTGQYTGTIYAYNVATGQQLWKYSASAAPYYYESAYGADMTLSLGAVANGMIYTYSTEHSPTNPLWRQSYTRCINLTDGTLIWKLELFGMGMSIADGYLVSASQYDNLVYCIGKGPSATTVSAPNVGITQGSSALITGTV